MLYGLNGYYLRLLASAGAEQFLVPDATQPQELFLQAALTAYTGNQPALPSARQTFEKLFRRKAKA
jgi:hypothetical protein